MGKIDTAQFQINWRTLIPDFEYLRTISFADIIDILIVAYIIYRLMKVLRGTSSERLVKGIVILGAVLLFANAFHFITIAYLLQIVFLYGGFVLIVIFQPELRRMLEQIGKGNLSQILIAKADPDTVEAAIHAVSVACADMSKTKTGALIVFERTEKLGEILNTGTKVNAETTVELVKNIFYPKSPLHDGAMIIREGRIYAAACVLPLSGSTNISRDLGTRHRAAIGMSESSDSVLVVVSEETGAISVAIGGMLKRNLSKEVLEKVLSTELMTEGKTENKAVASLRNIWKGGKEK